MKERFGPDWHAGGSLEDDEPKVVKIEPKVVKIEPKPKSKKSFKQPQRKWTQQRGTSSN